MSFAKNELKRMQKFLSLNCPEHLESEWEDEEVLQSEDEIHRRKSRVAFLKFTLHFLRRINQGDLADLLQSSKYS